VMSVNNFPMASGIASSASGFSALTVAGCAALGLDLDPTRLSAISRRGSGSASRSHFGGFVAWEMGQDDATSVAVPLFPPDHWDLHDIVVVVSSAEKQVSSESGHTIALTSPLLDGRIRGLPAALETVRRAIADRDLAALGPVIEQDALAMHSVMMTSQPSLLYWQPGTLQILHAVRRWREIEGLPVYFTIDAGPNVHLICEAEDVAAVQTRLFTLSSVERAIVSRPGSGPQLLDQHLF
jgi:diphosphomevalonate decarboxylase